MNNDISHIKQLLEAYYRGETSPGQEREISAFFADTPDVPAELEPDRELFLSLDEAAFPDDIEQSLISMIDREAARPRLSPLRRWVKMVAAVAVVGFGIGTVVTALHYETPRISAPHESNQYYSHLTGSDLSPEQVEKQTLAAVQLLARTLQMGESESTR